MPKNLSIILPKVALSKSELIIFLKFFKIIKDNIKIIGIEKIVPIISDIQDPAKKSISLIFSEMNKDNF